MAPTNLPPPRTPSKITDPGPANLAIETMVDSLCFRWDLGLQLPKLGDSPMNRGRDKTIQQECVFKIKFICYQTGSVTSMWQKFDLEAKDLYTRWVKKPMAERGVVPEVTRHTPHPVTETERDQLLHCLLRILNEECEQLKERSGTPKSTSFVQYPRLDDSPVPMKPFRPVIEPKRPRNEVEAEASASTKKARVPDIPPPRPFSEMGPPSFRRQGRPDSRPTRSADTSFTSEASSVFSRGDVTSSWQATQETAPVEESLFHTQEFREAFHNPQADKYKSSDYASSSFEARVADVPEDEVIITDDTRNPQHHLSNDENAHVEGELSQDLLDFAIEDNSIVDADEQQLRDRLQGIFRE